MDLFLTATIAGLLTGSLYALLGAGFHLTLGVIDVVNFSYGILIVCASYGALELNLKLGVDPFVAAAITGPIWYLVGLGLAPWVMRSNQGHLFQILLTFGIAAILEGLLLSRFGPDVAQVQTGYTSASLTVGPVVIPVARLAVAAVSALLIGILAFYLNKTASGRAMRAIAQNPTGAAVVGIRINALRYHAFALSSGIAGLVGAFTAAYLPFSPFGGFTLLITAFIVTALGGLGSLAGVTVAGLLVAMVQVYSQTYLPSLVYQPLIYLVLIGVLWLRPTGIFGTRDL